MTSESKAGSEKQSKVKVTSVNGMIGINIPACPTDDEWKTACDLYTYLVTGKGDPESIKKKLQVEPAKSEESSP